MNIGSVYPRNCNYSRRWGDGGQANWERVKNAEAEPKDRDGELKCGRKERRKGRLAKTGDDLSFIGSFILKCLMD